MVVDLISQRAYLDTETIQRLADRHFGIGFDQLLIVEPPDLPEADFKYRIFNADGSEVEQCGNGVRCFARFVHERHLTTKTSITVQTKAGIVKPELGQNGWFASIWATQSSCRMKFHSLQNNQKLYIHLS